jgi:hypothetical protein
MTLQEQESFINSLYNDLFVNTDVSKIPNYCASNFVKQNNYDISNYQDFVTHVQDLHDKGEQVSFQMEFLVNVPKKVVLRVIVHKENQITGAPPLSLLISYWQFDNDGLIDYCKEVESSS